VAAGQAASAASAAAAALSSEIASLRARLQEALSAATAAERRVERLTAEADAHLAARERQAVEVLLQPAGAAVAAAPPSLPPVSWAPPRGGGGLASINSGPAPDPAAVEAVHTRNVVLALVSALALGHTAVALALLPPAAALLKANGAEFRVANEAIRQGGSGGGGGASGLARRVSRWGGV
jgi:hypothetical protein